MPSPYGFPQAADEFTPPSFGVVASYVSNVADLTAATTTCDTSVTLVEGDLVLLTEQSTGAENGIYVVGAVASGVAPLTRWEKMDTGMPLQPGTRVYVSEGTARGNGSFHCTNNDGGVIGTTAQVWAAVADTISHVGAHSLEFTTTGATAVMLPTTGTLATLAGAEVLAGKTLTTPTIGSFVNAGHNHSNAAGGGQITPSTAFAAAVPVTLGGTGLTTIAKGGIVRASAADTIAALAVGAAYKVVRANSAGDDIEYGGRVIGGAAVATFVGGALTINVSQGSFRYIDATAQNSTLALDTANAAAGDCIDIVRATAGAHTVAVNNGGAGAGTLMTMTASKVAGCRVGFDGTNWRLVSSYQEP